MFRITNRKLLNFLILTFTFAFLLLPFTFSFALNLDKLKVSFLSGDYKAAIQEGEKLMAAAGHGQGLDELYYLLGVSYLKDGNYLRASDIFEIILKEFKKGPFLEQAKLGLGDTYFLRNNFLRAESCYKELLLVKNRGKYKAELYYRLSQTALKKGDSASAEEYRNKLKSEFPLYVESTLNQPEAQAQQGKTFVDPAAAVCYTVQVGSFSKKSNADALRRKLSSKGYDAYLEEAGGGKKIFRVKVGRLKSRPEAVTLQKKLSKQGYSTKICP